MGSVNHFTGRVFYSQFGYNHIEWAVYLCVIGRGAADTRFLALNAFCLGEALALLG